MSSEDLVAGSTGRVACFRRINPQWARLQNLPEMSAEYIECRDEELLTSGMVLKAAPSLNLSG